MRIESDDLEPCPARLDQVTSPAGRSAVHDVAVLADLEAAFGRARLDSLLDGLSAEIAKRLDAPPSAPRRLADDAHVLTSVGGTLGFMPLSRACAALERACLSGADLSEVLRAARAEAERALAGIAALRRAS